MGYNYIVVSMMSFYLSSIDVYIIDWELGLYSKTRCLNIRIKSYITLEIWPTGILL